MIFLEYLRIFGIENTTGGSTTYPRGWRARPTPLGVPPASWDHSGPPPLIPAPTHFIFLPQTRISSSSTSSSSSCCHFRSPCSKHLSQNFLGDCSLVCDSSIGPISFCSSALFIANFCCLGDHVLELACQIYMVPSSSSAWYIL